MTQDVLKDRLLDLQNRVFNRPARFLLNRGLAPPTYALLETTGRRTGRARQVPVANGLQGEGDLKHQALTQRELHVARLAAAGLTNNEIAERTRRVGAHGRVAPLPRLRQSSASPAAASSITNSSSTKTTCWPRVDGQAQGRRAQGFRVSFTPRTRHAGVEGGRRDAGDCINDCCTRRS